MTRGKGWRSVVIVPVCTLVYDRINMRGWSQQQKPMTGSEKPQISAQGKNSYFERDILFENGKISSLSVYH